MCYLGWAGGCTKATKAEKPHNVTTCRLLSLGIDVTMCTCTARLRANPVWFRLLKVDSVGSGVSLVVSVLWGLTNGDIAAKLFFVFEGGIGSDDFFNVLDGGSQ